MDITSANFQDTLPLLLKSVKTAHFISFDFEFSGLNTSNADRTHDYDCDDARYQKLKNTVNKMYAFQIGLCTFKWEDATK